jgi:hypothetical protein
LSFVAQREDHQKRDERKNRFKLLDAARLGHAGSRVGCFCGIRDFARVSQVIFAIEDQTERVNKGNPENPNQDRQLKVKVLHRAEFHDGKEGGYK